MKLEIFPLNDARFHKGCEHFDAAEYFEAHEVWEEVWNEAHGSWNALLQGLIQVAVALHHAGNGNRKGAHKLFARCLDYLEKGKEVSEVVDIEKLRDLILDFDLALQSEVTEFPFFKLPRK